MSHEQHLYTTFTAIFSKWRKSRPAAIPTFLTLPRIFFFSFHAPTSLSTIRNSMASSRRFSLSLLIPFPSSTQFVSVIHCLSSISAPMLHSTLIAHVLLLYTNAVTRITHIYCKVNIFNTYNASSRLILNSLLHTHSCRISPR